MNVLITAGPTREPLDPVRFLSNRSSGKMGYAMAHAFADAGHRVLLISGPSSQPIPGGVDFTPVETASDMFNSVARHIGRMDIAIFAAAVADYAPLKISARKIKKSSETLTLELVRTKDILGSVRQELGFTGVLVGFAAETDDLEDNARRKLVAKGCDLVIGNDVSKAGLGFDSDRNEVILVFADRTIAIPEANKIKLADQLAEEILQIAVTR